MRLPKFEYVEVKTVQEACSVLAERKSARILAGGTDLLVNMKNGVENPLLVVNLKNIPELDFIQLADDGMVVGTLATLKKVYSNSIIAEQLSSLAHAASAVGSYHHQVMGTVGGNICQENRCNFLNQSTWWRSARPACLKLGGDVCHVVKKGTECFSTYHGELAPVLMVLGAELNMQGHLGARTISIESLFTGDGKNPLAKQPDEIVTSVSIPREAMQGASAYLKYAERGSIDFPIVGVSVWISQIKKEYRIALTAVDRKPLRARQAEDFLRGQDPTEKTINHAGELCAKEGKPVDNTAYAPSFKRAVMKKLLGRAISMALGEQSN